MFFVELRRVWSILCHFGFCCQSMVFYDGGMKYRADDTIGLVALFSGIIAMVLFLQATVMVSGDMQKLAAVEAPHSMKVLFANRVISFSASFYFIMVRHVHHHAGVVSQYSIGARQESVIFHHVQPE